MANYENLKTWIKSNRQKVNFSVCAVIIFIVGFGAGRAAPKPQALTANYSKSASPALENDKEDISLKKQEPAEPAKEIAQIPPPQAETGAITAACPVKVSKSGIFHVKGGSFYDRTKPVKCFNTEAEAKAAGFRKSSR